VADIAWCIRDTHDDPAAQHRNVVTVTLRASCLPPLDHLDRRGVSTSACGVCGRTTIADLEASGLAPVPAGEPTTFEALRDALESLDEGQTRFRQTGGMHAAARASRRGGGILDLREDVGRHNALDKLVGAALLDDRPFGDDLVLLSGRASYELLQKAAAARIGVVAAVGAPSSLAIDVAERFDITLVGFLRSDRANVYTHAHRILSSSAGRSTAVASSGART
jgi:FdhD protein